MSYLAPLNLSFLIRNLPGDNNNGTEFIGLIKGLHVEHLEQVPITSWMFNENNSLSSDQNKKVRNKPSLITRLASLLRACLMLNPSLMSGARCYCTGEALDGAGFHPLPGPALGTVMEKGQTGAWTPVRVLLPAGCRCWAWRRHWISATSSQKESA